MKQLVELFCDVDDFCKIFIPQWHTQLLEDASRKQQRVCRMSMSAMMNIIIGFHVQHHRDFKNYYVGCGICEGHLPKRLASIVQSYTMFRGDATNDSAYVCLRKYI